MQYKKTVTIVILLVGIALLGACSEKSPYAAADNQQRPGIVTQMPPKDNSGSKTPVEPDVGSAAVPAPTATPTPTPTPTPIPTVPPAPVAVNTDIENTDTFLVNREYPMPADYAPKDLVAPDIPFSFSGKTADKRKMRKAAADALEELYHAALNEEGLEIYGVSAYRSYDRQYDIYATNLINKGLRHTNLYSAAPGTSEHQTGLAIDVSCASIGYALVESFAATPEGIWLKENSWRFGFNLRYQKNKESITGYAYEPWHIRYVGVPLAYYLYTNDMTLDEYYGTKSKYTLSELAELPMIDTATSRFYSLYASVKNGQLITGEDGAVAVSTISGYPYLRLPVTDAEGQILKAGGKVLYMEPVVDAEGKLVLSEKDAPYYKKPYFDAEGKLFLTYNNVPVFLEPIWTADGIPAKDAEGNVLYTEPVADANGHIFITADGGILQKVPMRADGELLYLEDGSVLFYEPLLDPFYGTFYYDENDEPLFAPEYYEYLESLKEPDASDDIGNEDGSWNAGDIENPQEPEDTGDMENGGFPWDTDEDNSGQPEDGWNTDTELPEDEFGIEGQPVG